MIKYAPVLFTIFILVQSQRPPYAGSSKPYPAVLPQYLEEQAVAATAAPVSASNSSGTIVNRIDATNDSSLILVSSIPSTSPSTTTIPSDIPIDALGDINLINKIKTWPREKQPFWFINWQQIQEHRGDSKNPAQPVQTQPNTRSFFAG